MTYFLYTVAIEVLVEVFLNEVHIGKNIEEVFTSKASVHIYAIDK